MIFSNMKQTFNQTIGFVTGAVVTSIIFSLPALVFWLGHDLGTCQLQ